MYILVRSSSWVSSILLWKWHTVANTPAYYVTKLITAEILLSTKRRPMAIFCLKTNSKSNFLLHFNYTAPCRALRYIKKDNARNKGQPRHILIVNSDLKNDIRHLVRVSLKEWKLEKFQTESFFFWYKKLKLRQVWLSRQRKASNIFFLKPI